MKPSVQQCAAVVSLALGMCLAQAQPASAPATKSQAAPRPAATTPANTVPYSPSQADTPDKGARISAAQRKQAKTTQLEARKACESEQDKKAKSACVKKANEDYRRAVTP